MARSREHILRSKATRRDPMLRRVADRHYRQALSEIELDAIELHAELAALEALLYEAGFGGCDPERATVVVQRKYYH